MVGTSLEGSNGTVPLISYFSHWDKILSKATSGRKVHLDSWFQRVRVPHGRKGRAELLCSEQCDMRGQLLHRGGPGSRERPEEEVNTIFRGSLPSPISGPLLPLRLS